MNNVLDFLFLIFHCFLHMGFFILVYIRKYILFMNSALCIVSKSNRDNPVFCSSSNPCLLFIYFQNEVLVVFFFLFLANALFPCRALS